MAHCDALASPVGGGAGGGVLSEESMNTAIQNQSTRAEAGEISLNSRVLIRTGRILRGLAGRVLG